MGYRINLTDNSLDRTHLSLLVLKFNAILYEGEARSTVKLGELAHNLVWCSKEIAIPIDLSRVKNRELAGLIAMEMLKDGDDSTDR